MQEIINLLCSYSAEIAVSAVIASVLAFGIGKNFSAPSAKNKLPALAFLIGAVVYSAIYLLISGSFDQTLLQNLLTAGALSAVVTAVVKSVSTSKKDAFHLLKKLLSDVVIKDKLDEVAKNIVEKLSEADSSLDKNELNKILKESVEVSPDEETLERILKVVKDLTTKQGDGK